MPYKNIEDRRASVMRAYYSLRQKLYDLKGNRCVECGREDTLQVDHIEEDGRNRRRAKHRYKEYRRLLKHPDLWQLLCAVCHGKKTMRYVRSFRFQKVTHQAAH